MYKGNEYVTTVGRLSVLCISSTDVVDGCNGSYTFEGTHWTVSWTVTGRNITFSMFGPADGWLGIGFSETPSFQSVSFTLALHKSYTYIM